MKFKSNIKKYLKAKYFLWIIPFLIVLFADFYLALGLLFLTNLIIFIWYFTRRIPAGEENASILKTYCYKEVDGRELYFDLWLPKSEKEKFPLIFFAHGGGWIGGFRNQSSNVSWCKFFNTHGIAAISIDYRLGFFSSMEQILEDYQDALEYVKRNSDKLKVDSDNIVLMGLSAGAHLSLLYSLFYTSKEDKERMRGVKAVVSYYGPNNLYDLSKEDLESPIGKVSLNITFNAREKSSEELKRRLKMFSPDKYINENMIPVLFVHGAKDKVVPFKASEDMYNSLKNLGVKTKFLTHKTAGHSFDFLQKDTRTKEILDETLDFVKGIFGEYENY